jgi:integrase
MAPRKVPGVTSWKNKDGSTSYHLRWRQGGGQGPQKSHTYSRLSDAVDRLNQIRANGNVCTCPEHTPETERPAPGTEDAAARGRGVTGDDSQVPAYTFERAVLDYAEARTGIGTGYRTRFPREMRHHFAPLLDRPIAAITDRDVKLWIRGCEEGAHPWLLRRVPHTERDYRPAPLSPTTIKRLLVQAGSVIAAAQAEGHPVAGNPFRGHRLAGAADRHEVMRIITPAEWAILEAELPEGTGRDFARVLVGTGLRFSELAALRVGDVDILARPPRLHVRQAWKSNGRNGFELGPPKSRRSRRTVKFGDTVIDALAPHLVAKESHELVFTAPRGGSILPSNYYHRIWLPAVVRAVARGMSRAPRIHDLRHSHASWQLADGVALLTVSRRLGHETAAVTSDIYGHLDPGAEDSAVAAVERAMSRRS